MSPLAKYYLCCAVFVLGVVGVLLAVNFGGGRGVGLIEVAVFLFWAVGLYAVFGIGCPSCGKRLGFMNMGLVFGFPGRRCTRCDADLTARTSS